LQSVLSRFMLPVLPSEGAAYAAPSEGSTGSINLESTDCKCGTELTVVTSGYFTESDCTKVSFSEQRLNLFPPLNLDASEDKSDTACELVHSTLKTHAVLADGSSDRTNLVSKDSECQTRLTDVTSSYPESDAVDWSASVVYTEPSSCPLMQYSSGVFVHERRKTVGQLESFDVSASAHGDVISRLLCFPPVAAAIFRHASDSDLCRY